LVMFEYAVRVLSEAPVVGPPRRLYVGHAPGLRSEHAQQCLRVRGASPDLEIERLLNDAPLRRPECGQLEDEILEGHERLSSFSTFMDFGSRSRCMVIRLRWR